MGSTARPERQAAYGLPFGAVVWAEAKSSSGREAGTSRRPGTEPITRLVHADDPLGRGSGRQAGSRPAVQIGGSVHVLSDLSSY